MRRQKLVLAVVLGAVLGLAGCNREQSDWEKARAENSTDAYESFVKKYPNGAFSAQAQARLKEQYEERDWQKARDVDTIEAYQAFLTQYPEGKWSQEARIRVENFALAQATPGGPAQPESAAATPEQQTPPVSGAPAPAGPTPPVRTPATPAAKPAAAVAAKSASTKGTGDVVQLGAFKSGKAAADHHWAQLKSKYPQLLKGLEPVVRSAKTGHGTVYRLQVAGLKPVAARSLCKKLTAHAEACVVVPKLARARPRP
jgi:cell division protein FtsN